MVVPFMQDFARPWGVLGGELGVLFAVYAVTMLATLPFAGRLCDRIGAGHALRLGAGGLLLSLLLFATANNDVVLFVARAVQGAAAGMTWTSGLALLAAAFPAERRGRALGFAMAGMSLGSVVGPAVGGRLFDWGGPRMPFWIAAGWTLAEFSLLLVVRLPSGPRVATTESSVSGGLSLRGYERIAGVVVVGAFLLCGLEPTLPSDLEARLGARPSIIGDLFALAALAYGIASPAVGWAVDRWGGRPVIAVGLAACAAILPLAANPRTWWGEAAALAGLGSALAFVLAPTLPEIAAACERNGANTFGAAYAIFNLAYAVGMAGGQMAGGWMAPAFGFGPTLFVFSAVAAAYLPVLIGIDPNRKRERSLFKSVANATGRDSADRAA